MKYPALAAVILAVGIALGLILQGTVFETAAAKPPPQIQPVEEQNVDAATGAIRVIEQGVADPGPLEFTYVFAETCVNQTELCLKSSGTTPNVNPELESLSAQGWTLIEITYTPWGAGPTLSYTFTRPIP